MLLVTECYVNLSRRSRLTIGDALSFWRDPGDKIEVLKSEVRSGFSVFGVALENAVLRGELSPTREPVPEAWRTSSGALFHLRSQGRPVPNFLVPAGRGG